VGRLSQLVPVLIMLGVAAANRIWVNWDRMRAVKRKIREMRYGCHFYYMFSSRRSQNRVYLVVLERQRILVRAKERPPLLIWCVTAFELELQVSDYYDQDGGNKSDSEPEAKVAKKRKHHVEKTTKPSEDVSALAGNAYIRH
jgi:hypothetical protein